ncbi:MAG: amidohydrolase family protein [Bacteroidota bacterium]
MRFDSPWRRAASGFGVLLTVALFAAPAAVAQAQDDGVPEVSQTFLIENARIVQAPGRVIDNGHILVEDGLIVAVGTDVTAPIDAHRIAGDSLVVYAGFIDGLSQTGVPQPRSERPPSADDPGNPTAERAGLMPHHSVVDDLVADDKSVDAMRKAGFTVVHAVPYGRMIPGQGAIVALAGDTPSAMTMRPHAATFMQFTGAQGVYPGTPMAMMAQLRQTYREAERRKQVDIEYQRDPNGRTRAMLDPVHQAFFPIIDGDRPVFFNVESTVEIHRALRLQEDLGFPLILGGLGGAAHAMDELKDANVPLFLSLDLPDEPKDKPDSTAATYNADYRAADYDDVEDEANNLKARRQDALEAAYGMAGMMRDEGLDFGFSALDVKAGDIQGHIHTMVEHGLSEDDALAALTTTPARLLGLDGVTGTIDEGKIANLVVMTDSYFSEDAQVKFVFVDGHRFEYETKEKKAASEGDGDSEAEANPQGSWAYTVTLPDGSEINGDLSFSGSPGNYTGTIENDMGSDPSDLDDIEIDGNVMSFSYDSGSYGRIEIEVTLTGDTFDGSLALASMGSFPITGTRTSGPDL